MPKAGGDAIQRVRIGNRSIDVSHPAKVLFPQDDITKLELVEYYRAIGPHILPHLRDRPINLERFPAGISHPGFFQQGMPDHYPEWIESVLVKITLHAWLSRRKHLDRPDMMIFDVDPPSGDAPRLKDMVRAVGDFLRERGVSPFLKTTGSRGYHVVVPRSATESFDEVRRFAGDAGEELDDPKMTSARFTVQTVLERVESGVDPWKGFRRRAV